jgi:endonuclease/exonuclease/phosphatase family metal-dependent hydrolase
MLRPTRWCAPPGVSRRARTISSLLLVLTGLVLAVFAASPLQASSGFGGPHGCRPAKVMTWNLYLGADLRPAFVPQTPEQLLQATTRVAVEVAATDFPTRAKTIARDVDAARPDLIGLQEAALWRTQYPSDPATQAQRVKYDFLAILQHELAARGLHYAPVATVTNSDVEVPTLFGFDLRLTDRDVILARTDLGGLRVTNPAGGNFVARLPIPNPFLPVSITRGWVSVDAALQGCPFRLVSTHLEGDSAEVQQLQAAELVKPGGPAGVPGPLVLVGDFNSPADRTGTPTYGQLIDVAGFQDAWSSVRTGPGNTCCHDVAVLLRNPFDRLSGRIDLILTRGGPSAIGARRYGARPKDWFRHRIWPSDHAAVAARIALR